MPDQDINERPYVRHFIDALSCRRYPDDSQMTPLIENPIAEQNGIQ